MRKGSFALPADLRCKVTLFYVNLQIIPCVFAESRLSGLLFFGFCRHEPDIGRVSLSVSRHAGSRISLSAVMPGKSDRYTAKMTKWPK
jgi:hypothetical protein